MNRELKILLLESTPADAELIVRTLTAAGMQCTSERVDNERDFRMALARAGWDLIVSDFALPGFDGMAALKLARSALSEVPFIFVSGAAGEERAIDALKRGASDYVLKSNVGRLAPAVMRALEDVQSRWAKRQAERRLRDLVETSQDWIWELNAVGRFTYSSPSVREILGYDPDALLGSHFHNWIHEDDRLLLESCHAEMTAGQPRISGVTARWRHANGSYRWLERHALALLDADGKVIGYRGTDRDVTVRKQQDARITRLNRVHAMLSNTNAAVVRIRDRTELLNEICRIAVEIGGYRLACVLLIRPGTEHVRTAANWGAGADAVRGLQFTVTHDGGEARSMTEQALLTQETVVCDDVRADPAQAHLRDDAGTRALRAAVALPLVVDGTSIGTLNLYAAEAQAFTEEELGLLRQVSAGIAFALQYLEKEDAVQFLSYFDPLTSLARRSLFCERLARRLAESARIEQGFVLLVFDVVRLSAINDRYGRHVGDRVLQMVAERLKAMIRDPADLAHLGGGSFGVMFGDVVDSNDAAYLIREQIGHLFDRPYVVDGEEIRVNVRSGLARFPEDGATPELLLKNAETALRSAREAGEKYLHYMLDMNAGVLERMNMEHKLRHALEEGQFLLFYQPKVSVDTGRIEGVEALMRWQDPETGLVAPGEFIPILEDSGMIVETGLWVLRQALADGREWRQQGAPAIPIAVNVSNLQLRRREFVDSVLQVLRTAGVNAPRLDIEITESALMEDIEGSTTKLQRLKSHGVGIAIDDFGTGYSSLGQLSRLAVDALKIDRSFIHGLSSDPANMTIVSTIIGLARAFDLKAVAEGVETHEQLKLLRLLKCHQLQGYLIGRPVPAAEMCTLLVESGGTLTWPQVA